MLQETTLQETTLQETTLQKTTLQETKNTLIINMHQESHGDKNADINLQESISASF